MGLLNSLLKKVNTLSESEREEFERLKEEQRKLKLAEQFESQEVFDNSDDEIEEEQNNNNQQEDIPRNYELHENDTDWFLTVEAEKEFNQMDNMAYRIDFINKYLKSINSELNDTLTFKISAIIADGMYNSGIGVYSSLKSLLNVDLNPIIKILINGELDGLSKNEIINRLLCAIHNRNGIFEFEDLTQLTAENAKSLIGIYTIEREIIWFMSEEKREIAGFGPYDFFGTTSGIDFENSFSKLLKNENNSISCATDCTTGDTMDSLYDDVVEFVKAQQKASTSLLQRRFGIGYNRAARLIDTLEDRGIIGPSNGVHPRIVYDDIEITLLEYSVEKPGIDEDKSIDTYNTNEPFLIKLTDRELGGWKK